MPTPKSQTLSLLIHAGGLACLLFLNWQLAPRGVLEPVKNTTRLVYVPPLRAALGTRSGGANRDRAPASHGAPPPRALHTFIPPVTHVEPRLPMPVGIDFDVPVVLAASHTGDPYSQIGGTSLGTGGVDGIGDKGCCGGIGDHRGAPGLDGQAGFGGPVTPPRLIYKIEPEFSEEARKAKYQGIVVLSIEVDVKGEPSHFRVISGPGLGLEQKAIEAVARWRFKPAFRNGKPFATSARIEVSFHLL